MKRLDRLASGRERGDLEQMTQCLSGGKVHCFDNVTDPGLKCCRVPLHPLQGVILAVADPPQFSGTYSKLKEIRPHGAG